MKLSFHPSRRQLWRLPALALAALAWPWRRRQAPKRSFVPPEKPFSPRHLREPHDFAG